MYPSPGDTLLLLCQHAKKEVFLAAPFIKKYSLNKILTAIPADIERLTVVTRWIPTEIASGVSDLEVFDLLEARSNTQLLLHPCLHAKYYRMDNRSLVGSANITAKALGWCPTPNIELLIEVNLQDPTINALETQLKTQSIVATKSIRLAVERKVEGLRRKTLELLGNEEEQQALAHNNGWLPVSINSEYLYRIYSDQDTSGLLDSVVEAGRKDIDVLSLLPGMTEENFRKYIAAIVEQTPVAQEIHSLSKDSGITSEAAEAVIGKYRGQLVNPLYDAETYWKIFKAWLMYCFPQRYRIRPVAEVLEQAKEIY